MIGIIGYGIVGQATQVTLSEFSTKERGFIIYDLQLPQTRLRNLKNCEYIFICLPTPSLPNGKCDTSLIEGSIRDLKELGFEGEIIIRSTVSPGTCETMKDIYPNVSFMPEFLTESRYIEDAKNPEYIVVGGNEKILDLFDKYPSEKKFHLDLKSAELLKYSMNTFYAVKVIFANEMYDIAQKIGADWDSIREIIQTHPFVGKNHFDVWYGGFRGYGGKCLPKDTKAIAYGFNSELLQVVDKMNDRLRGL